METDYCLNSVSSKSLWSDGKCCIDSLKAKQVGIRGTMLEYSIVQCWGLTNKPDCKQIQTILPQCLKHSHLEMLWTSQKTGELGIHSRKLSLRCPHHAVVYFDSLRDSTGAVQFQFHGLLPCKTLDSPWGSYLFRDLFGKAHNIKNKIIKVKKKSLKLTAIKTSQ